MKQIIYISQLLLVFALLAGCQKEELPLFGEGTFSDEMISVPITVKLPNPTEVTTRGTEYNDKEKKIDSYMVAIFAMGNEGANDNNTLIDIERYTPTTTNGTTINATFPSYSGLYRVKIMVNIRSGIENKLMLLKQYDSANPSATGVTTFGDFMKLKSDTGWGLYNANNSSGLTAKIAALPMASGVEVFSKAELQAGVTINLTNLYARITVDASQAAAGGLYTFTSATLSHGPIKFFYDLDATPPEIKLGASGESAVYYETYASTTFPTADRNKNIVSPIYLLPNTSTMTGETGETPNNPTDVYIRGTYKDAKGYSYPGYYKIRIRTKIAGTERYNYDIKHNTLYKVVIKEVKAAGYPSLTLAKASEPANTKEIDYEIVIDDPNSHEIVVGNGEYYLGVSNSTFDVFLNSGKTNLTATTVTYGLSENAHPDTKLPTLSISTSNSSNVALVSGQSYKPDSPNEVKVDVKALGVLTGFLTIQLGDLALKVIVNSYPGFTAATTTFTNYTDPKYTTAQFEPKSSWLTFTGANSDIFSYKEVGNISYNLRKFIYTDKVATLYVSDKSGNRTKALIERFQFIPNVGDFYPYGNKTIDDVTHAVIRVDRTNNKVYLVSKLQTSWALFHDAVYKCNNGGKGWRFRTTPWQNMTPAEVAGLGKLADLFSEWYTDANSKDYYQWWDSSIKWNPNHSHLRSSAAVGWDIRYKQYTHFHPYFKVYWDNYATAPGFLQYRCELVLDL